MDELRDWLYETGFWLGLSNMSEDGSTPNFASWCRLKVAEFMMWLSALMGA